ncbi:hypothetical protein Pint_19324 [Pistacia integerrima]|uniref:Uncharacterized protein n=1 Tax=Pistacia integerrima TaxID=434235 RepID=A0ACC0Z1T1_9ROSI|nr:hypothetical protein Pint_19324 [Pistacia integerrima]
MKSILRKHKKQFVKQKVINSYPSEFSLVKRFWKYILDREEPLLIENLFLIRGQSKDEFVTAGGVPLSEGYKHIVATALQSEFMFVQNAWSGGYIVGTSIGKLASNATLKERQ